MKAKLLQNKWLWISRNDLQIELKQLEEEGRDTSRVSTRIKRLAALGDTKLFAESNQIKAGELLDEAQRLPIRKGYGYVEPSDLAGIRKLRPRGPRRYARPLSNAVINDRIHGAWLGRCIGCLLGKPVEGVRTDSLWPFLKATGQYPLSDYMRFSVGGKVAKEYPDMVRRRWVESVRHMPVDDDTNYTTTGLLVMERRGTDLAPADIAQFWMGNIPMLSTCTAERVAYRNFALHIQPPASAAWRNPYREWIGAQIRADGFGYVAVGNPALAADLAWRDASISHVKNGIYGEMFVAAMIAAAPYAKSIQDLIAAGLSEIPRACRLASDVATALEWYRTGLTYDDAVARIHKRWDERDSHDWCHTNSNAVICVVALLYAEGDFEKAICRAVWPCFDTDCNGATVGSIMGMLLGAKKLPGKWTGRLNDTLHTSLAGNNVVKISDMADRTFNVYRKLR